MLSVGTRIAILANLDETPLDPYRHGLDDALGFLEPIVRASIPLVFFSTRTRAELEAIHQELGIRHPFVAEHGGALYVPQRYFGVRVGRGSDVAGYETLTFGRPHDQILATLTATARRLHVPITTMSELSVRDVATAYGATFLQARLAKLRDHGELFRVEGGAGTPSLVQALRAAKLRCRPAGPFIHVSANVDTAGIVEILQDCYRRSFDIRVFVGIGHPQEDKVILRNVEVPLVWSHRFLSEPHEEGARIQVETVDAHADGLLELIEGLATTFERSRLSPPERSR